ncbi:MAG: hypothetical protein WBA74_04435, partial [Cyclobacteriaceae bacterium]
MRKYYLLIFLYLTISVGFSYGQEVVPQLADLRLNGSVESIVVDDANDVVYIGGDFTRIGGLENGAAIDRTTADFPAGYPEPNGQVIVAVPDGNDGFYIGGNFTEVGGLAR